MNDKKKVILDTDIGSDIDDAVCLAYLLSQPKCELMGITTVSGQPVKRAAMADAMCRIAGKKTPIHSGAENPMIVKPLQPEVPQFERLGSREYSMDFPENSAVDFLRKTIRENPHEITLLAIGPFTNIGILFLIDPEIPSLLKELVLMSGKFLGDGRAPEWNVKCDPHAAKIMYNADVKIHRSIGIDVTSKVTMERDEVREKFKAEILQPVLDFSEAWFSHTKKMTFHDPLAAATVFDDTICEFSKGNIDVETAGTEKDGFTYWEPSNDGRHEAALKVDADRFTEHYFSVVK